MLKISNLVCRQIGYSTNSVWIISKEQHSEIRLYEITIKNTSLDNPRKSSSNLKQKKNVNKPPNKLLDCSYFIEISLNCLTDECNWTKTENSLNACIKSSFFELAHLTIEWMVPLMSLMAANENKTTPTPKDVAHAIYWKLKNIVIYSRQNTAEYPMGCCVSNGYLGV